MNKECALAHSCACGGRLRHLPCTPQCASWAERFLYIRKGTFLIYKKLRLNLETKFYPRFHSNKRSITSFTFTHVTCAWRTLLLHSQDRLPGALHSFFSQRCFQPVTPSLYESKSLLLFPFFVFLNSITNIYCFQHLYYLMQKIIFCQPLSLPINCILTFYSDNLIQKYWTEVLKFPQFFL